MALLFCDSFDHYNGNQGAKSETGNFAVGTGRNGTNGALLQAGNNVNYFKTFPTLATVILGFALNSAGSLGSSQPVCALFDSISGSNQITLEFDGTHHVVIKRGSTVLGTSTSTFSQNVFRYVEWLATIHPSAGVVKVWIDGILEINLSSQNTRSSANSSCDQMRFTAQNCIIDDFVILDTTGSAPNNDHIGDVRVQALLPNGDGNSSQWVGSDGNSVNNSLLVDETSPPNGDTDYVTSGTIGDKDTYAYGNLTPTSGTVFGVQITPYMRKDDAGVRSVVSVARLAGVEADGPVKPLSTSYAYLFDMRETAPGGAVWTVADVNAAEFGAKVNA